MYDNWVGWEGSAEVKGMIGCGRMGQERSKV